MPTVWAENKVTGVYGWSYGIPNNLTQVAWWSADQNNNAAPKPGGPRGNSNIAVFVAHTGLDDVHGVFAKLSSLREGDSIYIGGIDAKGVRGTLTMRVIGSATAPKANSIELATAINQAPAATRAVFGTCAGRLSSDKQTHKDNRVVFADIVAWAPAKGK
jgi:hypothetical protein